MKETSRRRGYLRALTRRHYIDPLLLREGFYASRDEAARCYLYNAARLRPEAAGGPPANKCAPSGV